MFKNFLIRKLAERQLKDMPAEDREKVLKLMENNPELFEKIAAEVAEKVKGGMSQTDAAMQVMRSHEVAIRKAMQG